MTAAVHPRVTRRSVDRDGAVLGPLAQRPKDAKTPSNAPFHGSVPQGVMHVPPWSCTSPGFARQRSRMARGGCPVRRSCGGGTGVHHQTTTYGPAALNFGPVSPAHHPFAEFREPDFVRF